MELKHGINLGGFLSQCVYETEHFQTFIVRSDIRAIKEMGFDHVRLPIDCNILEKEDGTENQEWSRYVTETVEWCQEEGLSIILDLHKAYGYDFNDAGNGEKNNLFTDRYLQDRFVRLWMWIAKKYSVYPHVAFELLNEVVEKENAGAWNELIARTVQTIRSISRDVLIIYGGIQWNSVKTLKLLEKPQDRNILFTFHFYEPLIFTHQKAHWVPAMDPNEEIRYPEEMAYYIRKSEKLGFQGEVVTKAKSAHMGTEFVEEMIGEAIDAAEKAGVGLYCGEFGVIDRAPVEDTGRWFQDVVRTFRQNRIGFALWSYKEMDFGFTGEHYAPIRENLLKHVFQCKDGNSERNSKRNSERNQERDSEKDSERNQERD